MTGAVTGAELVDLAGRRSSSWWLLSRLVIDQPQEPWLSELEAVLAAVDPDAATPLGPESACLLGALRSARNQPDGLTALAVDRTRLLAGVMQKEALPAPYESAVQGLPMCFSMSAFEPTSSVRFSESGSRRISAGWLPVCP